MTNRPIRRAAGALLLIFPALEGCAPPDRVEVAHARELQAGGDPVRLGASAESRFGGGGPHGAGTAAEAPAAAPPAIAWDLPAGWEELPASGMRAANLRPAGNPDAECTVILLGGSGGSELDNVNRWRGQMGLAAVSAAELGALPTIPVLGRPARRVELRGDYTGMGGEPRAGWGLLGALQSAPGSTVFVKMTGPEGLVAAEAAAFDAFCASLRLVDAPVAGAGGPAGEGGALRYALPEGWRDAGPQGMREVNLVAGETSQCYVIRLAGDGGGLIQNLNRWRGEFGLPPLDAAAVAALPTVAMLGEPCPLLEAAGEYQGMGGDTGAGKALLATLRIRPAESLFVKMVGPAAEVAAERAGFLAFVASLEESGG
ncbi:MAG: hypothetical protein AB1726_07010 [Planctomycetota bacterium]